MVLNNKKVELLFGNNEKYDFYIFAEKHEVRIEKNSLAYKLTGNEFTNIIQCCNGSIIGNFDYVIEKFEKGTDDFKGHELVNKDEIKIL
ncbi:MAG TPA: hypothetical protein PK199_05940 [Bacteroidales bacterium]|nr:hypothetical protein [Bacteroidales bacterium]